MPFTVISRCLSAICVLIALAWSRDLFDLAGTHGLLDPSLAAGVAGPQSLSLFQWVSPTSGQFDAALLLLFNGVALSAAALFWKPRSLLAALALYLTYVCFKQTIVLFAYGVYEFIQLGLFYVLAANTVAFAYRRDDAATWQAERLVGWFFRGHIALAYLFAGLCKAVGPQWWTGESLWRALARSDSTGQRWFQFDWIGHYPLLLQAAGIGVVALESLYPLAFIGRLRSVFVGGAILMHLSIIVTQGLTLFGLTMISLNVYFWMESREWDARESLPQLQPVPAEL